MAGRQRIRQRRIFSGRVVPMPPDRYRLRIDRGAWRKTVDRDGAELSAMRETRAVLWANVGDYLVVADADLLSDAIACVEVTSVDETGMPTVRVACGTMPTRSVHVMPAMKATQRRKAA